MLELPNFRHMTTSTTEFESHNFVSDIMDRNYDVITFMSKYLYFMKAWSSHFC